MKKFFIISVVFIIFGCAFISFKSTSVFKILDVKSPVSIYIDLNKNFIFDEKTPFFYDNIFFIESSKNYSDDNILKNLTFEQKFILEYMAYDYANSLLKNKFVSLKGNDIYINAKSYKKLLLSSDLFFTNDKFSKEKIINKANSFDINSYYILNLKSKKIHKLSCNNGISSKKFKLISANETNKYNKAKCCFNNDNKIKKNIKNYHIQKVYIKNTFSSDNISIYFLDLNSTFKPDNKCLTSSCKVLKKEIDSAKSSIDFALYGFNNQPVIYKALINAKSRGIKIRWVSNYDNDEDKYYPDIEKLKTVFPDFKTNQFIQLKNKSGIMHNKFFIFDNKKVFTGTANITSTDLSGFNANYSVLINNSAVAKIYLTEFEQMFNGDFGINKNEIPNNSVIINKNTSLNILFSPQNNIINNYIIKLIDNSKNYIYISAFFITHKGVEEALKKAKAKGVDIKIINDATNARNKYTIHKNLRLAGIKVKTENYAGKMHMKTMVIDDKYSVIGSMNFTSSGNKRNDENVIVFQNIEIAKYLKSTFIYLWNKIPDKYEKYDPKAESLESIGSCYDGIDNDFDDKIDFADEGCVIKK